MIIHLQEALFIITAATVYSAPNLQKLEDIKILETKQKLEDSSSSEGYLSNDAPLRENNKESSEENRFEGYIFDPNICKIIDDRILCGYDRNKVESIENEVVDIGNGCFIRNDRIECGYFTKENPAYLRLRSFTEVNDLVNTTLTVTSSNINEEEISITDKAVTTMSSISLPEAETPTGETTDLLKTHSEEFNTGTEQVGISSDIVSTTLLKPVLSNSSLTATSMKEADTTISSSSTLINLIANLTINKTKISKNDSDLENQSEVESTTIPMLHMLKRSIEQIHHEKVSSKCSECPLRISETHTTTLSPREVNSPDVYSSTAKMDTKYLKYNSDKVSTKTACVENDDRVVCYSYKAI